MNTPDINAMSYEEQKRLIIQNPSLVCQIHNPSLKLVIDACTRNQEVKNHFINIANLQQQIYAGKFETAVRDNDSIEMAKEIINSLPVMTITNPKTGQEFSKYDISKLSDSDQLFIVACCPTIIHNIQNPSFALVMCAMSVDEQIRNELMNSCRKYAEHQINASPLQRFWGNQDEPLHNYEQNRYGDFDIDDIDRSYGADNEKYRGEHRDDDYPNYDGPEGPDEPER